MPTTIDVDHLIARAAGAFGNIKSDKNITRHQLVKAHTPMYEVIIKDILTYVDGKFDELKDELKSERDRNELLVAENVQLKSKVIKLEDTLVNTRDQVDAASQYNRRDNIKIIGVPYEKDEDLDKKVKDIMKHCDVELKDEDVSVQHRLHTGNDDPDKPPSIILRLARRNVKTKIFNNRKLTVTKPGAPYANAQIFEDVTPLRSRIMFSLRNRLKENGRDKVYRFVWSREGRIYCHTEEESQLKPQPKPKVVNCPVDLIGLGFTVEEIEDIVNNKNRKN